MGNKEKIEKLWFDENYIFIQTHSGKILKQILEYFPILKNATAADRENYEINKFRDAIHWSKIDEDIQIDSFYEKIELQTNEIGKAFKKLPEINVSAVARSLCIHKSLLAKYIYGVKVPNEERKKQIETALKDLGKRLLEIKF